MIYFLYVNQILINFPKVLSNKLKMKNLIAIIFIFVFFTANGQKHYSKFDNSPGNIKSYKPAYQDDYPIWAKMLYNTDINYNSVLNKYKKWNRKNEYQYKPLIRYFKNWSKNIQTFVNQDGEIEYNKFKEYHTNLNNYQNARPNTVNNKRNSNNWKFLGPKETYWLKETNSPDTPKPCPWQVNVYSFDVSKKNMNIIYCGTETGYVNKSINNGETWKLLGQDYNFGGGVTAVAIDPTNENIVYVAAGSQIHKSQDGGLTWSPLLPEHGLFNADRLTIDINNPDKILAASNSGVYITSNGGLNWIKSWDHASYDVHIKPFDSQVVYTISDIAGKMVIAVSNDGGISFVKDENFFSEIINSSGGLLAVTPADPDKLFAIVLSENSTPFLFKGDYNLASWEKLATGQTSYLPLNNGQGYFDLVLEVSPIEPDVIYVGTTTLYKSMNGGQTFSIVGGYGGEFPIHPDIQDMKILDNGEVWVSTDGGMTHSLDNFTYPTNAIAKNNGLIGSDMWGFDQGWNEDLIVGGRYHNGNTAIADFYQPKALRMGGAESPTGWVIQGKSRHVAFNDLGTGWILPKTAESLYEGRFIFSKYPNMDEYGGRRGNLVFHPNYYHYIYLGEGNSFWKSSDMGQSYELLHDFKNRVRFLQISIHNPNVFYADIEEKGLYKSEDGGLSWVHKPSLTNGQYGDNYWKGKMHFVISPSDENVIYVCLQNGTWTTDIGKVFKSVDGGDSWTDWTGTLHAFTKNMVIQPDSVGNDIVYLFTEANNGVLAKCFVRENDDVDWNVFGDDFPAGMSINLALPFFRDSKIRVAGDAGIWETYLIEPNFKPIINPWAEKSYYDCMFDTIYLDDHSIINHENCKWNWKIVPEPLYISNENSRNPKVVLGAPGNYDITLTISKNGKLYSKTVENMVSTVECPSIDNCDNPAFLDKNKWNLLYVDSEETNYPGAAVMAFDNDPSTIWHTRWSTGSDPYPHEIQIGLDDLYLISEFVYEPRQNGVNGRIKEYELYFSDDYDEWGEPVKIGIFENSASPQKIAFDTLVTGQYFKLKALSEVNDNAWTSIAELSLKGCLKSSSIKDDFIIENLEAFPVPTNNIINVNLPGSQKFDFVIYNISGNKINEGAFVSDGKNQEFDFSNYSNGVYLIVLKDENNIKFRVKVIKN